MKFRTSGVVRLLQVLLLALACQATLANELTGILTVEISGLKDATGNVYIAVYGSDSTWLSDATVLRKKVAISETLEGDLVRTELQLPLGAYALSVFLR